MRHAGLVRIEAGILIAMAGGCGGMQVGPGGAPNPVPGRSDTPATTVGNTPRSLGDRGTPSHSSEQICRDAPIPRGWVAVDFVSAPGTCAPLTARETGANAVLITFVDPLPEETVLLVCSGQRLPRGWTRTALEDTDAASGRCPRRPGDTGTTPTVMRIRRQN